MRARKAHFQDLKVLRFFEYRNLLNTIFCTNGFGWGLQGGGWEAL